MIKIRQPFLEENQGRYYIKCVVEDQGKEKEVFFGGVGKEYKDYLLYERSDAFLVGLLSYAMRTKQDIQCEAPVSEELLYNIRQYLVPLVVKYGDNLYDTKIEAKTTSEKLPCGNMVGASASGGVDSFNTIKNQWKSEYPSMNITHLCLNNVGAYNDCYGDVDSRNDVKNERYHIGAQIAEELGLKVILTESNFGDMFVQNHLYTNTYSSMFSVLCMRKAWKTYYYSSAFHDMGQFSLYHNQTKDTSYYDLLTLNCFSTDGIKIYSEGGEKTRYEKVKNIANFPPVKKYLHVCFKDKVNCGVCDKCRRTLLCLDLAGELDNFKDVFDVETYRRNKKEYLQWFYGTYLACPPENQDMYDDMHEDLITYGIREEFEKEIEDLKKKKIIIYGYGDLGKKIAGLYQDSVTYIIDNFVQGENILTLDEFKQNVKTLDEDCVCMITSFSKFKMLKEELQKYYPDMVFVDKYIITGLTNR